MRIGLLGLGKMGMPLALNIGRSHAVTAYDASEQMRHEASLQQIDVADSIESLLEKLPTRKVIWLMVPAGKIVDDVLENLVLKLHENDIVIDGGNSFFKDSMRRANWIQAKGIHYLDCGTSGGVEGALNGVCAMIGGSKDAFDFCEPLFNSIALPNGYLYCGKSGSGHFVKMVHNGIEYGMMQSIAEGFDMLHQSDFNINLPQVAKLYDTGSVIRGWLMELTERAFAKDPVLGGIKGIANASGEAQWMVDTAQEMNVPVPATQVALDMRYASQAQPSFSAKVVAALRNEFGGHAVEKA